MTKVRAAKMGADCMGNFSLVVAMETKHWIWRKPGSSESEKRLRTIILLYTGLPWLLAGGCVGCGRPSPLLADMCLRCHPSEYNNTSALSLTLAIGEHLENCTDATEKKLSGHSSKPQNQPRVSSSTYVFSWLAVTCQKNSRRQAVQWR